MTKKLFFFLVIVLFFASAAAAQIYKMKGENDRLHTDLIGQTEKYEQISESVGKLQLMYVDQKDLKKAAEQEFEGEVGHLRGRIKVLSNATFLIREKARVLKTSDLSYDGKRIKYVFNELRYEDGPPIGYIMIFDDGRVVSKVYNHEFACKSVISRDEGTGRYTILNKAVFTLKSPSLNTKEGPVWTNRAFNLKITGGEAFIDPTEPSRSNPRFFFWAPRLNFGIGMGVGGESDASLGVSLMGYGVSKRDLDWKFLDIGANLGDGGALTPRLFIAQWRFWRDVMPNTYIGAGFQFDNGVIGPAFGLTFGF